jgi:tetratricopeptide (TPR) repeat protein
VQQVKGGIVFVIAGLAKPKRYYLWETFTIEDIQYDGNQYTVTGPGWMLFPPQLLQGKASNAFKATCANFVSFRSIDDLPYRSTLLKLAEQCHLPKVNQACEDFCNDLIQMLPGDGDAWYYRGTVRQLLGKTEAAQEDFTKALELKTNFRPEAEAALAGKRAPVPQARGKPPVVVTAPGPGRPAGAKGAAGKKATRGAASQEVREKLLRAYGGRLRHHRVRRRAGPRSGSDRRGGRNGR